MRHTRRNLRPWIESEAASHDTIFQARKGLHSIVWLEYSSSLNPCHYFGLFKKQNRPIHSDFKSSLSSFRLSLQVFFCSFKFSIHLHNFDIWQRFLACFFVDFSSTLEDTCCVQVLTHQLFINVFRFNWFFHNLKPESSLYLKYLNRKNVHHESSWKCWKVALKWHPSRSQVSDWTFHFRAVKTILQIVEL